MGRLSDVEAVKRTLRALRKKLRYCDAIRLRQGAGDDISGEELIKLGKHKQWLKQIADIREKFPDITETPDIAAAADCSDVTAAGKEPCGSVVQLSGASADDIDSPWYYENVGFYDRGRVSQFAVSSCCWLDSSSVALSDYNGVVRVLNSSSSHSGHAFENVVATWQHSSSARCVISLTATTLLSVGSDCNVRFFDLTESRVTATAAMAQRLSSAVYDRQLQQVAVGCSGGALLLLDPQTLQQVQTLPGHSAEVTCVACCEAFGGPLLLTSSLDATVRLWDVRSGKKSCQVLRMQPDSTSPLYSVLACGSCIVAGDEDGEITAWQGQDFVALKSVYNNNGPSTPCYLATDSTGTLFSTAAAVSNQQGMFGCVLVRQGVAQIPTYSVGDGQLGEVSCLSLREDGLALLVGTLDGCVQLLSVRSDEAARTHKSKEWYWLDATISAEYCSTYRDAITGGAEHSHKMTPIESAAMASEPSVTSAPSDTNIQNADSDNSKATVRRLNAAFFYNLEVTYRICTVDAAGCSIATVRSDHSGDMHGTYSHCTLTATQHALHLEEQQLRTLADPNSLK